MMSSAMQETKTKQKVTYEEAKHICDEMGQACAGFVQESNSPTGQSKIVFFHTNNETLNINET